MRDRLSALTARDEHRLARRVERLLRDGADADPAALARVERELEQAEERVARRRAAVPAPITYPEQLPVAARREDLLAAIGEHQVVIVAGETGSGKTTQLPKLCLELGRGVRGTIAHTQPRRIAARTVAQRIADELDVSLGDAVGYSVRFNDRSGEDTLVRLMTDGLLLAELQRDRLLRRYDTIIVDEAHERSLNVDFLLGSLKAILPQRPDLKVIITSATIDPERFSAHFGGAPIVEVSGRTYPVEVRYRPLDDVEDGDGEADVIDAIGDAVDELLRDASGDVLVFLSGEREIRDTADALEGRLPSSVEVLPLYARLASAEQQRVFAPHGRRRVVLATNVAETSLTVPGIRCVVDPGTARISRYSARLKVQRLPIEPVSQASADQRKGRCGREADGICIRLYSEADFEERPRYTDPEILRTSLAAVILQMAAAGLGDVEDFAFLDPPDARQVRDGVNLLVELHAFEEEGRRLTPLGRRLARLPLDPRLGRMVLEADRLGCAEEVIVIAAGLSIQDPRERPADHQAQADQLHARFKDESSDFLALLNLWRHLRELRDELSGNQFRKRCREEFLHGLRVREWQDLVGQLRTAARAAEVEVRRDGEPADAASIHVALLSGLLSHVGLRDPARRDYLGARGARLAIFPGSALARRGPDWVMAAELVETSRLWARTVARVDPRSIEPLAEHLLRRSYDEPRWHRRRAQVVATERATLYGLPVVEGRTVGYARIDPVLSRELFIRRALVEGDWDAPHEFVAENARRVAEVEALEERTRRRDLLVDDQVRYEFFAARIPETIVSGRHFDRWWRDARRRDPEALTYPPELLRRGDVSLAGRPDTWRQGDVELALSYRFDPGSAHDGVVAHVPLAALSELRPAGSDWLVPALRTELVTALIRGLPKDLRRPLVPVPEVVEEVVAALRPRKGRLVDAVARELERLRGVIVPREAWPSPAALPPHLRTTFSVEDDDGAVLAEGMDLDALRAQLAPRLRARLSAATEGLVRHGLREWTLGTLPREVEVLGARGYPALVDEGADAGAGVAVLDTPAAQAASHWAGTRRLLRETVPSPARPVGTRLGLGAQAALAAAPHGSPAAVLEDAVTAALDALMTSGGGPAWDEVGFARLRTHVAGRLADETVAVMQRVVVVLDAARAVQGALDALGTDVELRPARLDVARQLGRLVFPGFVAATGAARPPATGCARSQSSRRRRGHGRAPRSAGCSRSCASASSRRGSASAGR